MRRVSTIVALSLVGSLLVAGPTLRGEPAVASSIPARGAVEGLITDVATGDPVPAACISIYRYSVITGYTRAIRLALGCSDSSGLYRIPDFPTSTPTSAYVEAPGYGGQWYPGRADGIPPTPFGSVTAPTTRRDVALRRATAGLSVHLTRQDGSPAAYATASLVVPGTTGSYGQLRTDANGNATRTDLVAGDYKVAFSGAGYATQYYPAKATIDEGETVTLTAGATVSLTEQFRVVDPMPAPPVLGTLTGTIRTPAGTPIAGATVTAMSPYAPLIYDSTTTGADGTYSLKNLPASGLLKVSAPGYATAWGTDRPLPVLAVPFRDVRDFVLRPGAGTLRGKLIDSIPGPVPYPTTISLSRYTDTWQYTSHFVGFDGSFEIPNLPAGQYQVTIETSGRPARTLPPLTITDGAVTPLDLTLPPPAVLAVHVVDDLTGLPIAGATLSTFITTSLPEKVTDAQGNAVYPEIWYPGQYSISARHEPYHFSASAPYSAVPGTTTNVTLRMRPGAILVAPVGDADPAYNMCVAVRTVRSPGTWAGSVSCAKPVAGAVTFGPLDPGLYRAILYPDSPDLGMQWVSDNGGTGDERVATVLKLTAGATTTAPAQHLGKPGSIAGTLTDARTKAPVAGCVYAGNMYWGAPGSECVDVRGSYRLDKLGPYAWPLRYDGVTSHASIWSGAASSRLDASLVPVTAGATTTYNFAAGEPLWFAVTPPSGASSWNLSTVDAQTGEYAGSMSPGQSGMGPGPKLLHFSYVKNGTWSDCWIQRPARLARLASGVYLPGPASKPTRITVGPGGNCLPTMPPLVITTPAGQRWAQMQSAQLPDLSQASIVDRYGSGAGTAAGTTLELAAVPLP